MAGSELGRWEWWVIWHSARAALVDPKGLCFSEVKLAAVSRTWTQKLNGRDGSECACLPSAVQCGSPHMINSSGNVSLFLKSCSGKINYHHWVKHWKHLWTHFKRTSPSLVLQCTRPQRISSVSIQQVIINKNKSLSLLYANSNTAIWNWAFLILLSLPQETLNVTEPHYFNWNLFKVSNLVSWQFTRPQWLSICERGNCFFLAGCLITLLNILTNNI